MSDGNDKETTPQAQSLESLFATPAGISFGLTTVFLVTGASYNLGLFFFIDPSLVAALPLSDHISASISIFLTLVALGVLLGFVTVICIVVLILVFLAGHLLFDLRDKALRALGRARSGTPAGDAEPASNVGRGQKRVDVFLEDLQKHAVIMYPIFFNIVMYIAVMALFVPDQAEQRLDTYGIFLAMIGIIAVVLYARSYAPGGKNGQYFRLAGLAILIYMLPFQYGVGESVSAFSYIYNKDHTRPYALSGFGEVHLLRAGSNGVFFLVRSKGPDADGVVRYQPWSKVDWLEYRLRRPKEP